MSNLEGEEFGVVWANVDDEELFGRNDDNDDADDDDRKEDILSIHNKDRPNSNQASHSKNRQEEEEDDDDDDEEDEDASSKSSNSSNSSVEEQQQEEVSIDDSDDDEDDEEEASYPRPSWVNDGTSTTTNDEDAPPPYTPSPDDIMGSNGSGVEKLSSSSSRLASYRSDLKLRFSETSAASTVTDYNAVLHNSSSNDDSKKDMFPKAILTNDGDDGDDEADEAFQESPWPDEDLGGVPPVQLDDDDDDDDDDDPEEQGKDVFSTEIRHTVNKPSNNPASSSVTKQLSNTWMKFDDDKWDSSKHNERQEDNNNDNDSTSSSSSNNRNKPASAMLYPIPATSSSSSNNNNNNNNKTPAATKKKKQGFSLEAGLAKVSKATKGNALYGPPKEEQLGGDQANELISFWGEGEEELEANTNDPLAMALKAKPQEQQQQQQQQHERRVHDSSIFVPPKATPHHIHPPPDSLGMSSTLPDKGNNQNQGPGWLKKGLGTAIGMVTSKIPFSNKPKDDEDKKLVEDNVVEVDDTSSNPPLDPLLQQQQQQQQRRTMADVSAASNDSAIVPRHSRRTDDLAAVPENNMHPPHGQNNTYDPCLAIVDKMNAQADGNNRIKFAKETKAVAKPVESTPIFDLFMDLPHPAADLNHFPVNFIGAPSTDDKDSQIQSDIQDRMREITCFAFPEYDSTVVQEDEEDGPTNTRRYAKTHLDLPGFQYYTFTMTLQSGDMIYAHVRRYLPPHREAAFRPDVGRRLGRAMIIFSRYSGGDDVFLTVLKTLDAIASQHHALHSMHILRPQKWFLQNFYAKHQRLCAHYATNTEERRGGPHIITLQGLEFADSMEFYTIVDATHFFLPNNLLHAPVVPDFQTSFNCSVLPVLRCLGVVNALRLFSALLSERRVILVSISPTRLDRSIRAALAMLAQGMLNWPHLCIPVLPPDHWSKLKSPTPYILGVLAPMAYRLELTDDLGNVVIFNLDENTVTAMGDETLATLVPDLCRCLSETMLQKRRIALPENAATERDMTAMAILNSTSDFLAQDLVEIVKADKYTMNGTAAAAKKMAKTAKDAVKSTLKFFLGGGSGEKDEGGEEELVEVKKSTQEKRMEPDAIYIEGCRNEAGEEAARLAFVSFFVRVLGNVEGYAVKTEDSVFHFNRDYFLRQRRERGDGEGSPMWAMLLNFCETQMAQDFVIIREDYIRKRQPIPMDAPLFWQCIDFLEFKNIDFGILNVRSVARMLLQKTSIQQMLPSNVRRLAMAITSKRKFEGHVEEAIADLAELSRESCSALYDVMSVVWLRARDCKGLQWVHGYQAMRVLKALLLHGPLPAVADAADGLQTIRRLAFRRSQGSEQIRVEAMEIYNLLADRPRLFLRRMMAAEQRRRKYDADELPLRRDTRLNLSSPFKDMHAAMNPAHRPPEPPRRRASLSARRASLSSRLPPRLSITKHIMALEPLDDSITSFPAFLPVEKRAHRPSDLHHDAMHRPGGESFSGSVTGEFASARRFVREIAHKSKEAEKERTMESVRRRDANAMGVELIKKQFMLLKVAIYLGPVFYIFGNHEHFLTIVMFVWLSQQLHVFRAPVDTGAF